MTDYRLLRCRLQQITDNVPHLVANLANASALIFQTLENINWSGFYMCEDGKLVLGPFQGKVACIEIPVGKGVCGKAVEKDETIVVDNVHQFNGHIACDSSSMSEIVIPIHKGNRVVGVLDIDSPIEKRFTAEDRTGLEQLVQTIESIL